MKRIIDIPDELAEKEHWYTDKEIWTVIKAAQNGTPIPDNATNGDVIKTMFGSDKVFGFIHYIHLMAKVGNWFNKGVVAEFDRDWWNAPYQKGGK